jgi:3-phosphoshikimate 1-carboxyvinyltransferase
MATGTTYAKGIPAGEDIDATLRCIKGLRVACERAGDSVSVIGIGKKRFPAPRTVLDCGASASTLRMLLGVLAGAGTRTTLAGHPSLLKRPIDRVIVPLTAMGATFDASGENRFAPVTIVSPRAPVPIDYELPVASAQVKSAVIMAALRAERGRTTLRGAIHSRDHTERLVPRMGGSVVVTPNAIMVEPGHLDAIACTIPGDPSTAAFYAAAAAVLRNSKVTIRGMCTNPTRTGFFEALSWMGGSVTVEDLNDTGAEPVGDVTVRWTPLKGITVPEDVVPMLVDEVPLLVLTAVCAEGETVIRGISELRVKETDRVDCMVDGLRRMGANIEVEPDAIRVLGGCRLHGAHLDPRGDHRMSMMFTIAAMAASGDSVIHGVECEAKSFPGFFDSLAGVLS